MGGRGYFLVFILFLARLETLKILPFGTFYFFTLLGRQIYTTINTTVEASNERPRHKRKGFGAHARRAAQALKTKMGREEFF